MADELSFQKRKKKKSCHVILNRSPEMNQSKSLNGRKI